MGWSRRVPVLFLSLFLAGWSAEAALMHQRAMSASKRSHDSKIESDENDQAADDSDDQDQDDDDNNDDAEKAANAAVAEADGKKTTKKTEEKEKTRKAHLALPQILRNPREAELQQQLAENRAQQTEIEQKLLYFSDMDKANEDIDEDARLVANETESPAMAQMLARMWKEMRTFDVPTYTKYLNEELKQLKTEETKLQEQLKKMEQRRAAQTTAQPVQEEAQTTPHPVKKAADQAAAAANENDDTDDDADEAAETANDHIEKAAETGADEHVENTVQGEPPAGTSEGDFWSMGRGGQETYLASLCVYLIAGLLLIFIYYQYRQKSPDTFLPNVRMDVPRSPTDFSFSILGCLETPNVCLLGCCCPCLLWGDTIDRHRFTTGCCTSFVKASVAYLVLALLIGITRGFTGLLLVIFGVMARQQIRAAYGIENGTCRSLTADCLAWTCCQPCALIQESRESSILQNP